MSRSNWLILTLAVLAAVAGGYLQHHRVDTLNAGTARVGQLAPRVTLQDLDGRAHALSDYRGRRVVLNFWATWCGPCLEEMPALAQAQKNVGENAAIVLGIAMDQPEHVRAFVDAHAVTYKILLGDLTTPSTSLIFGDSSQSLPYSVLIDTDGRILATHSGALTPGELQAWLPGDQSPH